MIVVVKIGFRAIQRQWIADVFPQEIFGRVNDVPKCIFNGFEFVRRGDTFIQGVKVKSEKPNWAKKTGLVRSGFVIWKIFAFGPFLVFAEFCRL